jgi:hypothetical protein
MRRGAVVGPEVLLGRWRWHWYCTWFGLICGQVKIEDSLRERFEELQQELKLRAIFARGEGQGVKVSSISSGEDIHGMS